MLKPSKALEILIEGNRRFVENKSIHPNRCEETRLKLLESQKPFAVVISCSDSRVPTEIVFDTGIGDIFIIRNPGPVITMEVIGAVEYAVESLGVKLIMILGHDNCGAVTKALEIDDLSSISENLAVLVKKLHKTTRKIEEGYVYDEAHLKAAIKNNIIDAVREISTVGPILSECVKTGRIKVVGANYSLSTGMVEIY